jgi:hypothetical protein
MEKAKCLFSYISRRYYHTKMDYSSNIYKLDLLTMIAMFLPSTVGFGVIISHWINQPITIKEINE